MAGVGGVGTHSGCSHISRTADPAAWLFLRLPLSTGACPRATVISSACWLPGNEEHLASEMKVPSPSATPPLSFCALLPTPLPCTVWLLSCLVGTSHPLLCPPQPSPYCLQSAHPEGSKLKNRLTGSGRPDKPPCLRIRPPTSWGPGSLALCWHLLPSL